MKIKNLVLGIGIFIVYLLVLNYGIETFYPSPDYQKFCIDSEIIPYVLPSDKLIRGEINCTINPTPQQRDLCERQGGNLIVDSYDEKGCPETYKCNFCNRDFTNAQKEYSQQVFMISIIIGIIILLTGYFIITVEPVSSALIASGIGSLVYGSMKNWHNLSNVWKFLLLLASLILLIWITIKLNSKKRKSFDIFKFKK